MLRKIRPLVAGFVALFVAAVIIIPVAATPNPWQWQDQSDLLPTRVGAPLSIVSENSGVWLASNGTNLYRYDGSKVTDLTQSLRDRQIYSIAKIFSDGRNWLIYSRAQSEPSTMFWLTDGYSWTNVTKSIPSNRGDFDVVGANGTWFIRVYNQSTSYDSSSWMMYRWNGTTDNATPVSIPMGIDTRVAGCLKNVMDVNYCQGANAIVRVNSQWYLIGGKTEVRNTQGNVTQAPTTSIWQWQGSSWVKMNDLPSFRYISGIWPGKTTALIATSDTTNPFASSKLWQFDGQNLEEMSDQALATGLLSVDAREIRAASNGHSWMILIGKKLVRFDGAHFTAQGQTRDFFTVVTASDSNVFVLGGGVSDANNSFMTTPITAKLVRVDEATETVNLSAPVVPVFSKVRGPRVIVRSIPQDATVGDGQSFTLRVEATDPDGIAETRIYVNGARVKTCNTAVCELTQTFWTNGETIRTIPFSGEAMDKQGFVNGSGSVTLKIDRSSFGNAAPTRLGPGLTLPLNTHWNLDSLTGTSWTAWTSLGENKLGAEQTTTYYVAAQNAHGLGRIELYTNGDLKRTCDFTSSLDIRVCSLVIMGKDYPADAQIFANARVFTSQNQEAQASWVTGMAISRDSSVNGNVAAATTGIVSGAKQFLVTLDPATNTMKRGNRLIAHVNVQNSAVGINRIEVYVNNELKRTCNPGNVLTATTCDVEIDTNAYPSGTGVSVYARVRDGSEQFTWSNTQAMWIGDASTQSTPDLSQNKVSVWSWTAPIATELGAGQSVTYSVGAWSAQNVQRIEMVVDGAVRKTCSFGNVTGNKECSITLSETDFADRHVAVFNARVTDQAGNKGWSDVRSIKVVRNWMPNAESLPNTLTIQPDQTNGYASGDRVSLTARGWSATGINRLEIYTNGQLTTTCPNNDTCRFTSTPLTSTQLEYQARLVDNAGRSTWTGVLGISQK